MGYFLFYYNYHISFFGFGFLKCSDLYHFFNAKKKAVFFLVIKKKAVIYLVFTVHFTAQSGPYGWTLAFLINEVVWKFPYNLEYK